MASILTHDGHSFKTVSTGQAGLNDAYYTSIDDAATGARLDVVGGMTTGKANQIVPWVNRGVDMVASSVASMPFDLNNEAEEDVKDDAAYYSLLQSITRNLYLITASLWVYGAAYLWPETNALGRNITLRFVRARFMTPIVQGGKLVGFRYMDATDHTIPSEIPLDKVIYFWMPNLDSAVRPGPAPVATALGAASLLYALDAFAAGYFNSGAVKVTVFEVPGNTQETDKDKFQNFLNRALSGVRNAFRNIVVRFGVKPTVIGSDLKDTLADKLTELQRDNVAVALRVPPSVISGKVSDVMNSRADKFTLYDTTVIPVFKMIAEALNEQLFSKINLDLVPAPERLPIMQEMQLDQGKALELLTGKPIFKVDEAREIMGLGKWSEGDPDSAPATPQPIVNFGAPASKPDATPAEKPPTIEDAQAPADAAAKAVEQFEQMVKQFDAARKLALANVGQPLGLPYDDELVKCKTKSETRAVLSKYHPRPLKAALDLAEIGERLNATIERALKQLGE